MHHFPNAREKFTRTFNGAETSDKNTYYKDNLSKENKDSIIGYDYATEEVDSFFANIDAYADKLSGLLDFDLIEEDVVVNDKIDWQNLLPRDLSQYSKDIRLLDVLRQCMLHWLETQRNGAVLSMLDKQFEEEGNKKN